MPTYEYRCPNGHSFERFYKTISASTPELPCDECQSVATRQLSGGAGLLFKGSGFYLTDYGKNAHRKEEKKPASESGGGESGKSETKSEGKKDAATKSASDSKPTATAPKTEGAKKPKSE